MDLLLCLANVPLSAKMCPQLLCPLVEVLTAAIERFGGELAGRDAISYAFVHIVSQGSPCDGPWSEVLEIVPMRRNFRRESWST